VSHKENPLRIAAVLAGMIVSPADGFRNVARDGIHRDLRNESIVHGDEDEALPRESQRLTSDLGFVPGAPAAAMDPNYDR
jgi:hypothetical protein